MINFFMGGASFRKKSNRRSHAQPIPMPSPGPPPFHRKFCNVSLIIAAFLLLSLFIILTSFSSNIRRAFGSEPGIASSHQLYTIEVVNEFPHDPTAFTQGLLYAGNNTLFESTGQYGQSSVRKVDLHTGKVLDLHKMGNSYFGEGLTLLGERLIQVTWLQKTGFIYQRNNLSDFKKFTHQMQDGWGLATDGKLLFGSDGTSMLYQLDPQTFRVTGKQTVRYNGREVPSVNELEYINGEVWANVWMTDCIARISHADGNVLGWILLHKLREGLVASGYRGFDVLNGIAWDKETNRLFVTGKYWPKLYEIKLLPIEAPFAGDIEQMCIPKPFYFGKP